MKRFNIKGKTIGNKILRSYLLFFIIPLSVITIINYVQSAKVIQDKSVEQFFTVTNTVNNQFDQYFKDIENLSLNILQNSRIQEALKQPYIPYTLWSIQQIEEEKQINNFLYGIYKVKPGISSIIVYGLNNMNYFYHPTRRWNISYDGTQEQWFEKTLEGQGVWVLSGRRQERQLSDTLESDEETVVTISRVINDLDTFKPIGVLYINIKLDMLNTLSTGIDLPNKLVLTDQAGNTVIEKGTHEETKGNNWIKVSTSSSFTKWQVTYFASKNELFSEARNVRNAFLAVTILLLILAVFIARAISASIAMPLDDLKKKMKEVGKGYFEKGIIFSDTDEIEELSNGFNFMVSRIKNLVEEIQSKEEQRLQTELSALQARINPHFMYNTLNGMRWIALMEGNQKIADLITSFVYLLKFSAKNKQSLITVEDEISLLKAYVDLMKMRYDKFKFNVTAEEKMSSNLIIPFILQPIVENAIFHGIVPSKNEGLISVELYSQAAKNIAIVRDNGIGMDDDKIKKLLSSENTEEENYSKIGIKNVYDRLKLKFGADADLIVESKQGEGTEISIYWPRIEGKEGNNA